MTNREGTPIWYEHMSDAPDVAQAFYGTVMGWTFEAAQGAPNRDYRIATATDGDGIAGLMKAPNDASFAPIWAVYFGVDDVDATTQKLTSLGGSVHMAPQDIPGVGRFAFVADPQGASFYLMRGNSDRDSNAFADIKSGHCSWNELVTSDQKAALDFYGALFDWEKAGVMPMGDMGDYSFISKGDTTIGAMMDLQKTDEKPYWNFAFAVPDIDIAKAAVETAGGTITHGPIVLPNDQGWLIQVDDRQGAKVMFIGPRKQEDA